MTDIIASIPCARPANDSPGFRVPGPRRGGLKRRGGVRTLAEILQPAMARDALQLKILQLVGKIAKMWRRSSVDAGDAGYSSAPR
jgi:hypothetical protein